jgi:adenosylhomocysteine nucleosidase
MFSRTADATRLAAGMTAVVAAMPEEARCLRRGLQGMQRIAGAPCGAVLGRFGGVPIALAVTGDGERNAGEGLSALLASLPIRRLLVIGVSGALSPSLEPCALLVAARVVREGGRVLEPDHSLTRAAVESTSARLGILISAAKIADSAAEKERLLALASSPRFGPVAVDLESAAYAEAATHAGIPWMVLRAVSDTAAENLPELLNACRDERGSVRRAAVLGRLFSDPRPLPALLDLRRRVKRCAEVLAGAASAVLSRMEAP